MQTSEQSRLPDIEARLEQARIKTWAAVEAIAAACRPGMTESEAIKLAQETLVKMGARKFWHKCHVRFGRSTVRSFDDTYVDDVLGDDDIFFVDIGPIWDGIEGDAGATFLTGSDLRLRQCRDDARRVFDAVRDYWRTTGATGEALYRFAGQQAESLGWVLAPDYVRGHRLAEFPHSFHTKLRVDQLAFVPSPSCWVLEIHVCDPALRFGAFHEDLLTRD